VISSEEMYALNLEGFFRKGNNFLPLQPHTTAKFLHNLEREGGRERERERERETERERDDLTIVFAASNGTESLFQDLIVCTKHH
jgi:hypothetical protein